jgi:FkbM family methyltransferase
MKRIARSIAAKFGHRTARKSPDPENFDAFAQQRRLLAAIPSPVIFDIGAHRGQTSVKYAAYVPNATIHAFEPFPESFAALVKNTAHLPQVTGHPIGLADIAGEMALNANAAAPTNSLLDTHRCADAAWGKGLLETRAKVSCRFSTVDACLAEYRIDRVDLLKLDVQGAEYKVLQGAANALADGRVDVIYMEIILVPTYERQWRLAEYLDFLEARNLKLYGVYNLSHAAGRLRQIDAIFVRDGR